MHARLVIGAGLPQGLVLDLVERRPPPQQREEAVPEGVAEDLAEIPDGLNVGIAGEDLFDGEGIVGVDQERHALRLGRGVEFLLRHARERLQITLQRRAVLLEPAITYLRGLAAVDQHHVLLQQCVPGLVRVIELGLRAARWQRQQGQQRDS